MGNILDEFKVENCCGCGACVNICPTNAISYSTDKYGFIIPTIDTSKCISCGKCERICPFKNVIDGVSPKKAFAAISKRNDVLLNSSSGGVFYSLAKFIIENRGCVFGATLNENFEIKHVCVETVDDLFKLQKSKYVQSFMGNAYGIAREKLKNGCMVLFSGTPCQIAAMRAFAKGLNTTNLYLVEVVCHGVPSQEIFNDYLSNLQTGKNVLKSYVFRYKRKLRNGMNDYLQYQIGNKIKTKNWPEDSFHFLFMTAAIDRDSCFSCKYAKKTRVADITLCDYWCWNAYHGKDFDPCSTISGLIINTEKGLQLIDQVKYELKLVDTSFENIANHNSCLLRPTTRPDNRQFVLEMWKKLGYAAVERWYRRKYRLRRLKNRLMMLLSEEFKFRFHRLKIKIIGAFRGY